MEGVHGVVKSESSNLIDEQEHTYVQEVKGQGWEQTDQPKAHTTGRAMQKAMEGWWKTGSKAGELDPGKTNQPRMGSRRQHANTRKVGGIYNQKNTGK